MSRQGATRPLDYFRRPSRDGTLSHGPSAHRRLFEPNADKPRKSVNPLSYRKLKLLTKDLFDDEPEPGTRILSPPNTRPITHDQLAVEAQDVYAGLVMVEAKCVEIDEKQSAATTRPLAKRPSRDGTLSQGPSTDKPRRSVNPLSCRKLKLPTKDLFDDEPEPGTRILSPLDTRSTSHDQLAVEVKAIYAGLVMVEAKCVEIDEKQSAAPQERKLNNEQWQALIVLHRQLLHEHHDFFLASGHPATYAILSSWLPNIPYQPDCGVAGFTRFWRFCGTVCLTH